MHSCASSDQLRKQIFSPAAQEYEMYNDIADLYVELMNIFNNLNALFIIIFKSPSKLANQPK